MLPPIFRASSFKGACLKNRGSPWEQALLSMQSTSKILKMYLGCTLYSWISILEKRILETSWKSPNLHPIFGLFFDPPNPFFSGILKLKKFLFNLGMKCWNSAFNAQEFENSYSRCTGRSSENICSHSGGANLIYKFITFVRASVWHDNFAF